MAAYGLDQVFSLRPATFCAELFPIKDAVQLLELHMRDQVSLTVDDTPWSLWGYWTWSDRPELF